MSIGLVLADDHPIFLQGLRSLLEREGFLVLAESADGFEAVAQVEKLCPDVAILDLSMPRLNGLDAARQIQRVSPRTKVIMLTVHREEQYVLETLSAGVMGYVLKSEAGIALVEAIREVHKGHAYLSPSISRIAVDSYLVKTRGENPAEILSPRELVVLQMIAEGNTTGAIAGRLGATVKIAETYRANLMTKLDIHEVAGLVRCAVRRGLVRV